MYSRFRDWCERVLRIPHDPTPPPGDEASARVFRAAPAYLKYQILIWAIGCVFSFIIPAIVMAGIGAGMFAGARRPPQAVLAMSVVIAICVTLLLVFRAVFAFAVLRLDFEKRWYLVTNRSLRIREGVVHVREMTITFANIQNLSVMQGPIQRWLGIADLQVDTAGGGSAQANSKHAGPNLHVAWFRGVDNAEEVRQLIQARLRELKDSGLGDHDDRPTVAAPEATGLVEALRAVHLEARALREAAAQS